MSAVTDPILTLMGEHRVIEHMLDALDAWADRVDAGDTAARATLGCFVELIHDLADGQHHAKEEGVLFAAMADAGFPTQGGPIAVMLHEHELLRRLAARMASAIDSWNPDATRAAREYAAILRQHILKEDRILYPMARQVLGGEIARVGARCAELDQGGASRRAELLRLVDDLRVHP
jgi:hemerythrin-like domain-containing protein